MNTLKEVPVPPQLEAAVGYTGEARWISLCWTACGDTCWYNDGRSSGTGKAFGYLGWYRHAAVRPHLDGADLGNSDFDGTQRVVIDRKERRAYLADTTEAREVLLSQWPAEPLIELTIDDWEALVDDMLRTAASRPIPPVNEMLRQLQEHSRLVAEMISALDEFQAANAK